MSWTVIRPLCLELCQEALALKFLTSPPPASLPRACNPSPSWPPEDQSEGTLLGAKVRVRVLTWCCSAEGSKPCAPGSEVGFPSGRAGLINPRPRGSDLRAPNGLGARPHTAVEISHPSPPWGGQTDRKPETKLVLAGGGLKRPSYMPWAGGFWDPRPALPPWH